MGNVFQDWRKTEVPGDLWQYLGQLRVVTIVQIQSGGSSFPPNSPGICVALNGGPQARILITESYINPKHQEKSEVYLYLHIVPSFQLIKQNKKNPTKPLLYSESSKEILSTGLLIKEQGNYKQQMQQLDSKCLKNTSTTVVFSYTTTHSST